MNPLTPLKFPLIPLKSLTPAASFPLTSPKSPLKSLKSLYSAVISRFLHSLRLRPASSSKFPLILLKSFKSVIAKRFRTSLRLQVSLAILIVFVPVALILLWSGGHSAAAAWFDELFAYRQALTIGNTGSAVTNRKVKIDVDTATLITAGKLQSDCDDIRFTDQGGNLLKYFLDSSNGACNTLTTDLWMLVPTIHSGNTILYMYYGNPSAGPGTEAAQFSEATFSPTSGPTAASEEKSPGPAAYWKFDEGQGTTANSYNSPINSSNTPLAGSISGAAWQTEDQCLNGKCLLYDGSDDVTTVTNTTSIDLNDQLAGAFTISGWIRANSDGEGDAGEIAQKGTSTYLRVTKEGSDGLADLEAKLDLATADATISVSNGLSINKWHHVAVVYTDDSDDEITAYIDGVQKGVSTDGSGAPAADTNNLLIGGNTAANFSGFIDEPKIYNYARTAAQIKSDFASRGSSKGVSAGLAAPSEALSEGLVGYWKMDETSGNRSDSSGNGNTLTDNNTVTSNPGKFGNAGQFTAANSESLSISDNANLSVGDIDFLLSAWVYLDSKPAYMSAIGKATDFNNDIVDYQVYYQGGGVDRIRFQVSNGTSFGVVSANTLGSPSLSTWYFVVAWHDATNNTINISVNDGATTSTSYSLGSYDSAGVFKIGSTTPNYYWDGRIDEVRMYKRVLSPKERSDLYAFAPGPKVHLKMDEGSGTSAQDSSGNSNTGTLNDGPTWNTGKFGKGVKLDGTNDDVSVNDFSY